MGGDNEGKRGMGCQGTCIKDTVQSQTGVGSRVGGGDGWCGGKMIFKEDIFLFV